MCEIRLVGGCHRRKERYEVSKLVSDSRAEDESIQTLRLEFQKQVAERAGAACSTEGGVDEKWTAVSGVLIESVTELVGKVKGRQPDWFRESMGTLKHLLQSRNCAYTKWLASKKGDDLERFKQAQIIARRAIRAAKNRWFQEKAEEAEKERFKGKKVWKCIRDMQHGHRGLLPSRAVVIHDENDELCSNSASQHQRWRRHFTTVLNVQSQCDITAMEKVRERKVDEDLASVPTAREVTQALGKLKMESHQVVQMSSQKC